MLNSVQDHRWLWRCLIHLLYHRTLWRSHLSRRCFCLVTIPGASAGSLRLISPGPRCWTSQRRIIRRLGHRFKRRANSLWSMHLLQRILEAVIYLVAFFMFISFFKYLWCTNVGRTLWCVVNCTFQFKAVARILGVRMWVEGFEAIGTSDGPVEASSGESTFWWTTVGSVLEASARRRRSRPGVSELKCKLLFVKDLVCSGKWKMFWKFLPNFCLDLRKLWYATLEQGGPARDERRFL